MSKSPWTGIHAMILSINQKMTRLLHPWFLGYWRVLIYLIPTTLPILRATLRHQQSCTVATELVKDLNHVAALPQENGNKAQSIYWKFDPASKSEEETSQRSAPSLCLLVLQHPSSERVFLDLESDGCPNMINSASGVIWAGPSKMFQLLKIV